MKNKRRKKYHSPKDTTKGEFGETNFMVEGNNEDLEDKEVI